MEFWRRLDQLAMEAVTLNICLMLRSNTLRDTSVDWKLALFWAGWVGTRACLLDISLVAGCFVLIMGCSLTVATNLTRQAEVFPGSLPSLIFGIFLLMGAVIFKVLDARGQCPLGTGLFHFWATAGVCCLFWWGQTLPMVA